MSTPGVKPGVELAGTYRILRLIAAGGIGAVYEAEQLRLHRRVAIKVLQERYARDSLALARFQQEAEVVSQLGHPHIVQVFDLGSTQTGEPYLVMELLEGETLEQRLDRSTVMPVSSALHVVSQLAAALAEAHAHGVVHRDLKPANVFLVRAAGTEDFVKILDFGISKVAAGTRRLTLDPTAMGTPNYMAPEQALGLVDRIDARSDQFALAAVCYEMLTGRLAFEAEDVPSVLYQVVHMTPPRPSELANWVPPALDAVLMRALAKEPGERYPSVSQFAFALENAARSAGVARGSDHTHHALEPDPPPDGARDTLPCASHLEAGQRARALEQDAAAALRAGDIDQAVDHAEQLFALAVESGDAAVLRVMGSALPLLDEIFERRLGATRQLLVPGPMAAPRSLDLTPQAASLLARFEGGARPHELIQAEAQLPRGIPRRHLVRMLAGLLRRGALVPVPPRSTTPPR